MAPVLSNLAASSGFRTFCSDSPRSNSSGCRRVGSAGGTMRAGRHPASGGQGGFCHELELLLTSIAAAGEAKLAVTTAAKIRSRPGLLPGVTDG